MTNNRLSQVVGGSFLLALALFASPAWAEDLFALETLRAGFYARAFPDFSLEDLEVSVKLLSEEIGNNVGIKTTVTVFPDIPSLRLAFEQGKVNFAVASSFNFANEFDSHLLVDGFRLIINSTNADSILVLSRKNEGSDTVKSLQGKRLALVESDPIADLYMDFLARSAFHQDFKTAFRVIPREKKANQIILKLFFGQADVVCVYQNTYKLATELNPQLLSKLQIISQLDGIPAGGGYFHKKVPPAFRERIISEALKLVANPRGQQLLQLFRADKVVRSTLDDLTATKKLYSAYKKLGKNK
jgi:ABC-type phosphate/phosphonate transport system substrate-binding protein